MEQEQWEALVRRLEPIARSNPAAYHRRVFLLAALGYAFIGALLAVLIGLGVAVVYLALKGPALLFKLLIPIGALFWVVLRSLYVRFDPPPGLPLEPEDAPELFRMIRDVRKAVRGPNVHRVLLDGEPNAGIVQVPRAGGIFGSRNYLTIGLPYLQGLSADEFRAVLAHELGHLSRKHGRFGSFVYRVRMTWIRLLEGFEERKSVWTGLVRRFFHWYVPYFTAYTFPAMRAHEFEADAAAAATAGPQAAASALVGGAMVARWLYESYWPSVYRRADSEPTPPSAYASIGQQIEGAREGEDLDAWYRRMLELETDPTDTHPSLAERIGHLGLDPDDVLPAVRADGRPSAASVYLGDSLARLVDAADDAWRDTVAHDWRQAHQAAQDDRRELEELERRETRTADEQLRRAELTERFRGADDALPRYRELLASANETPARFAIGRILLARGDDEGLTWLDQVIESEPEAVLPACELAYDYLRSRQREEEAERYRERAERQLDLFAAASHERSEVSVEDRLEPPDVPADWREHLRKRLGWHEDVAAAYFVRKRTEHFDETRPCYVLALVPRTGFRAAWRAADKDAEPLNERVVRDISLPAEVLVVTCGQDSPLARAFAAVPGSRIYGSDA